MTQIRYLILTICMYTSISIPKIWAIESDGRPMTSYLYDNEWIETHTVVCHDAKLIVFV